MLLAMATINGRILAHNTLEHIRIQAVRSVVDDGESPSGMMQGFGLCLTDCLAFSPGLAWHHPFCRTVSAKPFLSHQPVRPQPNRTSRRRFQILPINAPAELAERRFRRHQLCPHRIQMRIISHRPQKPFSIRSSRKMSSRRLPRFITR